MHTEPTPEHEWLRQLEGDWTCVSECAAPGDAIQSEATERVRMLGDLWAIGEMEGTMPNGEPMHARLTIGYDPQKQRFVGSWVGSPMASQFIYEGTLDAAKKELTLNTTGPSFTDPSVMAEYQDIVTLNDDGTRTMRSQCKGDDGSWTVFMRATFTRV